MSRDEKLKATENDIMTMQMFINGLITHSLLLFSAAAADAFFGIFKLIDIRIKLEHIVRLENGKRRMK